jgi:hypothetical protein
MIMIIKKWSPIDLAYKRKNQKFGWNLFKKILKGATAKLATAKLATAKLATAKPFIVFRLI